MGLAENIEQQSRKRIEQIGAPIQNLVGVASVLIGVAASANCGFGDEIRPQGPVEIGRPQAINLQCQAVVLFGFADP